jgi:hypothetical protein
MLNGIAPILIFNFKKLIPEANLTIGIPLVPMTDIQIPLLPIPIYLDEKLTGIYIDTENKNVDINTEIQTLPDGNTPKSIQTGINSTISIEMFAKKDSIGMSILVALCDMIFQKVTSQEYSVTYVNGAITCFGGLLHEFSCSQNSNDDLYKINLQLSKAATSIITLVAPAAVTSIAPVAGALPL